MAKFKGKYRSESHRLAGWDYSSEAIYFITFCVQDFECLFGNVIVTDDIIKMDLNSYGQIVEEEIQKSIEIRKNWIFHEWVVMPNHVHMLIEIEFNDNNSVQTHSSASKNNFENGVSQNDNQIQNIKIHDSESLPLPIHDSESLPLPIHDGKSLPLHRPPNSISSFIGIFKTVTTKQINELRNTKGERIWQPNYHDHIVRNYQSFQNIANYIDQNPQRWYEDRFNPTNPTKK